jgi:hypothetical protein
VPKTIRFICRQCNLEVEKTTKHHTGKFCSIICRNRALCDRKKANNPKRKACAVCSTAFYARGSKTCSMACKLEYGRRKRRRICPQCRAEYDSGFSRVKFCSRKCAVLNQTLNPMTFDCLQCGKHVVTRTVTSRPRKFCSRECGVIYHKEHDTQGRGYERRAYRGANWPAQSKLARERDGFICACGNVPKGEKLSVDHIIPFGLVKTFKEKRGDYIDPNELVNLISLCRSCHGKKTQAERKLLEGDMIGFFSEVKRIMPIERVNAALEWWSNCPSPWNRY